MRGRRGRRVMVVTAVEAERDAVVEGLAAAGRIARGYEVVVGGAGPAASAVMATYAVASGRVVHQPPSLVVSAGVGGGFAPAPVGSLAVAESIVAADLGAQTADGFAPVEELGFGRSEHRPPARLSRTVADVLGAVYGPVLTVSTVTGTAERAAELADRHPGAVAEAMEGFGVAEAAAFLDLPVLEIRAISNQVGPRDRDAWRIADALAALTEAFGKLPGILEVEAAHDGT